MYIVRSAFVNREEANAKYNDVLVNDVLILLPVIAAARLSENIDDNARVRLPDLFRV